MEGGTANEAVIHQIKIPAAFNQNQKHGLLYLVDYGFQPNLPYILAGMLPQFLAERSLADKWV
jgi:hypothetical protein